LPLISLSSTTGCWAKFVPLWAVALGWVIIASCVAAPGVIVTLVEVSGVSVPEVKRIVRTPVAPVIFKFVKVAKPFASVVAVSEPPKVFAPLASTAVIVTPACATLLPLASLSCTLGCWAKFTSFCAVALGSVVISKVVAAPGVMLMLFEVAPVRPLLAKLKVRLPAVPVMFKPLKVALPFASVVMVAVPPKVPPPVAIATVMLVPAVRTGLPLMSLSSTTGCCAKFAPLCAVVDGWVMIAICVAAPGVIVTLVEVSGVRTPLVKRIVRTPVAPVIFKFVKVARPCALVVAVKVPPKVFAPLASTAVIVTPACDTLLPLASFNCTVGCCAKFTSFCAVALGSVAIASWVAAPAVMLMLFEVTPVRPLLAKLKVRLPVVPVMFRPLYVALPFASVVMVAVPPKVPPPVAIATVMLVPAVRTGLPLISLSSTTGCWAKFVPLWAVALGWVIIASCVAAPGVIVTLVEVSGVSVPEVKRIVRTPVAPVIFKLVKVARPCALVIAVVDPAKVFAPLARTAVMVTPACATLLPLASFNCTVGCCTKFTSFCAVALGSVVMSKVVAAPGVMLMLFEVPDVSPLLVKLKVRLPAVPVMFKPLNVALPFASVVMVAVPPNVPPPLAMATVILVPAVSTGLPLASLSSTTGCCAKLLPDCAVVLG